LEKRCRVSKSATDVNKEKIKCATKESSTTNRQQRKTKSAAMPPTVNKEKQKAAQNVNKESGRYSARKFFICHWPL
jgi:hypothetical protein